MLSIYLTVDPSKVVRGTCGDHDDENEMSCLWYPGQIEIRIGNHVLQGTSGAWWCTIDQEIKFTDHTEWAIWHDISRTISRSDPPAIEALASAFSADVEPIDLPELFSDCEEAASHWRGYLDRDRELSELAVWLSRRVHVSNLERMAA